MERILGTNIYRLDEGECFEGRTSEGPIKIVVPKDGLFVHVYEFGGSLIQVKTATYKIEVEAENLETAVSNCKPD